MFEYLVGTWEDLAVKDTESEESLLDRLGSNDWELVQVVNGKFYFKRRRQE